MRNPRTHGLDRREVASLRNVLPGVRRACDAYVELVATSDLLASVAASLTESRAGALLALRAEAFEKHYGWVAPEGLAYFRSRTVQAPRDAAEGMAFVLANAQSPADAERCVAALAKKCEILWGLLDAVEWGGQKPRLAPAAQLRADEGLVVLPERAVKLSGSGPELLAACNGSRSIEEIAAGWRARHPEPDGVERDSYEFLEQMERLGVIEAAA